MMRLLSIPDPSGLMPSCLISPSPPLLTRNLGMGGCGRNTLRPRPTSSLRHVPGYCELDNCPDGMQLRRRDAYFGHHLLPLRS